MTPTGRTQAVSPQTANEANPFAALPLEDIHLPDAIGIWPLAPGWWVLIALSLAIAAAGGWWLWRYLGHQRPVWRRRKLTLKAIDQLSNDWRHLEPSQRPTRRAKTLMQLNRILKIHCKAYRPDALNLSGENWSDFLQQTSRDSLFSSASDAEALAFDAYQPASKHKADINEQLFVDARNWVKQPTKWLVGAKTSFDQHLAGKTEKTESEAAGGTVHG